MYSRPTPYVELRLRQRWTEEFQCKIFLLQQTGAGRTLSGDSSIDRKSYEEQHLLTKSWHLNNSLSAKRVLSHCYNGHFLEQLYLYVLNKSTSVSASLWRKYLHVFCTSIIFFFRCSVTITIYSFLCISWYSINYDVIDCMCLFSCRYSFEL